MWDNFDNIVNICCFNEVITLRFIVDSDNEYYKLVCSQTLLFKIQEQITILIVKINHTEYVEKGDTEKG